MTAHAHLSDTLQLRGFLWRGERRRNTHPRVTRDLERVLAAGGPCTVMWVTQCNFNGHNVGINICIRKFQTRYFLCASKHLSKHCAHRPQALEMAWEVVNLPHFIWKWQLWGPSRTFYDSEENYKKLLDSGAAWAQVLTFIPNHLGRPDSRQPTQTWTCHLETERQHKGMGLGVFAISQVETQRQQHLRATAWGNSGLTEFNQFPPEALKWLSTHSHGPKPTP